MRARVLALVFLLGCSSGGSSSAMEDAALDGASTEGGAIDDGSTDGGGGADAASEDGAAGDGSPSDGATPPPKVAYCQPTCTKAADCATASAAYDADNYACEGGLCKWVGCKSDAECQSSFASASYACRTVSGIATCVHTCAKPADCATASAAYDADNWACEAGACRWTGCLTDAECQASFASAAYVCRALPGGFDPTVPTPGKYCVRACAKSADCATASAAYDADNYACESGLCKYTGCNDDAECKAAFAKPNYACR